MIHYDEVILCKKEQLVKQCSCSNGVEAEGFSCPYNGASKCVSCYSGYHLSNNLCVLNQCQCQNGVATSGVECLNHGKNNCSEGSCHYGYIFENGECISEPLLEVNGSGDFSYSGSGIDFDL